MEGLNPLFAEESIEAPPANERLDMFADPVQFWRDVLAREQSLNGISFVVTIIYLVLLEDRVCQSRIAGNFFVS